MNKSHRQSQYKNLYNKYELRKYPNELFHSSNALIIFIRAFFEICVATFSNVII